MSEILETPAESTAAPTTVAAAAPAQPISTAAALARCLSAYRIAYSAASAKGDSHHFANKRGAFAYRQLMPSTETLEGIQALIACVAQGINLEVYEGRESAQLLYAAQVALSANKPPKAEKMPKTSKPKTEES